MEMTQEATTIPKVFQQTATRLKDKTALRQKKYGLWQDMSWQEYHDKAMQAAYALLKMGMKKGDFVAIIGENTPEVWTEGQTNF